MQLPNKKFLCYLYNRFSELRKDIRQSASRLASEFTLKFWNMYKCSTIFRKLCKVECLLNKTGRALRADKLVLNSDNGSYEFIFTKRFNIYRNM